MLAFRMKNNQKTWLQSDLVLVQEVEAEYRKRMRLMKGPFEGTAHHRVKFSAKAKPLAIHEAATILAHQNAPGLVLALNNERHKGVTTRVEELGVSSTTGNYLVDQFFGWLAAEYGPGLVNLGALVCKNIGATSSPSQHSEWGPIPDWGHFGFPNKAASEGGNAIDWYFAKDGGYDAVRTDASFYAAIHNADALGLENIIHWPEQSSVPLIWNPERGLHTYDIPRGGSDHRTHGHADMRPTRTEGNLC